MNFDLSNRSLAQKISILVLGITLFVTLTISGVGQMALQKVSAEKAKNSNSVASLGRLVDQGGAVLSPVTGADGRVVGMLVMSKDAGAAVMPASFDGSMVIQTADSVVTSDPQYGLGAANTLLLLAGIAVFAIVGFVGTRIARGLLEPLGQLEKDIDQLAKGNTQVRLHALSRTDEIGRIARSIAKIQESLVELARIKTQRFVSDHPSLVNNLKEFWNDLKGAVRNAKVMLSSDGQMVGQHVRQSWSNWIHNSLGIPKSA
ncbi:HAMP domain-containing protein [Rhodopseudomonas palustris]|uniref:Histidine kinase, HAMP region n=1 Tax=Rhodopseudomonas palustris (strain BisB18) TaxID=316056 RepID=Q21CP8_RHOPB